ncbi:glycosyltransferase family 4 protein [Patescibacteria group bacterium]|nr:glycosyltransferase family 4 protein [Patescibacteria group bacterium]
MQKPQVFIFSTAYLPMVGGAELAIKEITDRLPNDFDFTLFTARFKPSFPRYERLGVVEVYRLGFGLPIDKYFLPFLGYLKARRLIKKYKIQNNKYKPLLWGMMVSFGSIAAYFLKKYNPSIPFLLTLQEGDPEEYLTKGKIGLMGFWFKKIVPLADRIQAISVYLKNVAITMGADPNNIEVVPNGVDQGVFARKISSGEIQKLRSRFGIKDEKIVITASRLVHKNAVDVLIQAMVEIPEGRLFIAGDGPEEENLRELAKKLEIEKRIHFLGHVNHHDLVYYFAASHVFARPSRSEGWDQHFWKQWLQDFRLWLRMSGGFLIF